jgi:transcription elongation factor SPT5
LDQEAVENGDDDGWGSNSNEQSNPFGSTDADNSGGWGSSSGSTWAPSASADNGQANAAAASAAPAAIKEESTTSATSQVKRETMEADTMGGDEEMPVWFMERVCVTLKTDEATGVIKDITGSTATLELEGGASKSVRVSELAMVEPKEHDIVLVTGGADVGVEGELVCIDGTDAILKDAKEDFKIVDFVHLAKITSDS